MCKQGEELQLEVAGPSLLWSLERVWEHSLASQVLENTWLASIRDAHGVFPDPLAEGRTSLLQKPKLL